MARNVPKPTVSPKAYSVYQAPLLTIKGGADITHVTARFIGHAADGAEAEKMLRQNPAVHPLHNFMAHAGKVDLAELQRLTILREQNAAKQECA